MTEIGSVINARERACRADSETASSANRMSGPELILSGTLQTYSEVILTEPLDEARETLLSCDSANFEEVGDETKTR